MIISKSDENRKAGRKPGTPKTGGRRRGSLNKRTLAVKEAITEAFEKLGGVDRLVAWVKEDTANERIFWSHMFMKLLPYEVDQHTVLTHEEALDRLEARARAAKLIDDDEPWPPIMPPCGSGNGTH